MELIYFSLFAHLVKFSDQIVTVIRNLKKKD